jgi:hypothetical protein
LSPWWRRRQVPPKRRFLQEPHGVTTQKTPFFLLLSICPPDGNCKRSFPPAAVSLEVYRNELSALDCTARRTSTKPCHKSKQQYWTNKKSYIDVVYWTLCWNNETKFNIGRANIGAINPAHQVTFSALAATEPLLCSKSSRDRRTICSWNKTSDTKSTPRLWTVAHVPAAVLVLTLPDPVITGKSNEKGKVAVISGLPLWSSCQTSWLISQSSRVRFPALPDFLSSSGSGTGSTQPLWG